MKSLVVPLDLSVSIEELVPSDVAVLTVTPPAVVSGGALSWTVLLDAGEETHVAYTAEVPEDPATTEATVRYLVRGSYRTFGTFSLDLAGSSAEAGVAEARARIGSIRDATIRGDRELAEQALEDLDAGRLLGAIQAILRIREPSVRSDVEEARRAIGRAVEAFGAGS